MKRYKRDKKAVVSRMKFPGFTIVELLIVIVVIGILAAIVIVAYSGVQRRAQNASRLSNARDAYNLVSAYMSVKGEYPLAAGGGRCIGSGFPDDKCWGTDSATPAVVDPDFNSRLAEVGTAPLISTPPVLIKDWGTYGVWKGLGPVYHYSATRKVDGVLRPAAIVYFLDGLNQDCGLDNIIQPADGADVWPSANVDNVIDTTPPRYTTSNAGGRGTYCVAALPNL